MKKTKYLILTAVLAAGCSQKATDESAESRDTKTAAISADKTTEVTAIRLAPSMFSHEIV
ncbi:MAG: hypothetical protein HDS38_01035, partial [Bacteroides sp.]|nr:hypothetical protein [Bacteroides sp.]